MVQCKEVTFVIIETQLNSSPQLPFYRHSIQSVWEAMEEYTKQMQLPKYDRVAMLRIDVMYALPVDIFKLDKETMDQDTLCPAK